MKKIIIASVGFFLVLAVIPVLFGYIFGTNVDVDGIRHFSFGFPQSFITYIPSVFYGNGGSVWIWPSLKALLVDGVLALILGSLFVIFFRRK